MSDRESVLEVVQELREWEKKYKDALCINGWGKSQAQRELEALISRLSQAAPDCEHYVPSEGFPGYYMRRDDNE